MDFDPATMRARFAELGERREAILAASTPLRDQRDEISAASDLQITALNDQIREIETNLFPIDQERGVIARALGGRTGDPTAGE